MTILVEGENSFIISAQAVLVETDREIASKWAASHVKHNPALRWVLGKYVEADNANSNNQMWTLEGLRMAQPTVSHAPLNMLHRPKHIVGTFTNTEMLYPTEEVASGNHPYMEALAAMWKLYFPEEMAIVESAHNQGALFFSMECVSETITCFGEMGCQSEFAYAGPHSDTYCQHLNDVSSIRLLNNPHFLAGALVVPPTRPGWKGAEITDLSTMTEQNNEVAHKLYQQLKAENPQLSSMEWETLMMQLMQQAGFKAKKKKDPKKIAQEVLDSKKPWKK